MEGKGIFFILLIIIAILTLSLALMAGYLFFIADTPQSVEKAQDGVENKQEKLPDDSELAYYDLYTEKTNFNLKSEDDQIHVLQLTAKLKYFKNVKGIRNVEEKLTLYDSEIKELLGTYFQNVSIDEVAKPQTKERVKEDLTKRINDLLNSSEEKKRDIVYTIVFDVWFYQ